MPNEMDPKPPKLVWTSVRQSPEETDTLNREAAKAQERLGTGRRELEELFESAKFEDIVQAHEKAERIVVTVPDQDRYSAAAHILQILNDKKPKEILAALQALATTPDGRASTPEDAELALAFLMITDEYLG